jgi:putative Mn2+ efflux pump MntP
MSYLFQAVSELGLLSILLIALALSADCFAVALSGSIHIKTYSFTPILRTAATFGAFQAVMPALGWLAGRTVVNFISNYDHWVAFILLGLVGGRMIWESFRHEGSRKTIDISRGILLLTLAVATSIDALAVGLSFAFFKINVAIACAIIGAVAFGVTIAGFTVGKKARTWLGKYAEAIGGIILIAIGLRILLSHILTG